MYVFSLKMLSLEEVYALVYAINLKTFFKFK